MFGVVDSLGRDVLKQSAHQSGECGRPGTAVTPVQAMVGMAIGPAADPPMDTARPRARTARLGSMRPRNQISKPLETSAGLVPVRVGTVGLRVVMRAALTGL